MSVNVSMNASSNLFDMAIPRRKTHNNNGSKQSFSSDSSAERRLSPATTAGEHKRSSSLERVVTNDSQEQHRGRSESRDTSSYLAFRKRPRSEGAIVRGTHSHQFREEYSAQPNNNKSSSSSIHKSPTITGEEERRVKITSPNGTSRDSSSTSPSSKAERRSSVSSVKSTTSNTSSGSGFRRLKKLKKFSAGSKNKSSSPTSSSSSHSSANKSQSIPSSPPAESKASPVESSLSHRKEYKDEKIKSPKASTSSSPRKKKGDKKSLSVSDKFQETQLRLWKAAQEQNQKLQEALLEKKRLKRLKKQKRREEEEKLERELKQEEEERHQQQRKLLKKKNKGSSSYHDDNKSTAYGVDEDTPSAEIESGREERKSGLPSEKVADDASSLSAEKKLKRLKKLQRQQRAEAEAEIPASSSMDTINTASSATTSTSSTNEMDSELAVPKKKKKKRRLVKLGSSFSEGDDDNVDEEAPAKKMKKTEEKKKKIKQEEHLESQTPKKSSVAIWNDVPTTPTLTMGLADTVKTRVRSCNKNKDELELLQAASFESKKRKKNKQPKVLMEDGTVVKRKRGRPPKNKTPASVLEPSYDADVENPSEVPGIVKRKRGRPPKNKTAVTMDSMSDIAPSEASSSTTVVAGVAQKKKKNKKKKVKSEFDKSFASAHSYHDQEDHPLHFKKRMAAAAAADASSWERHATSTTASKISISSSGTGAGGSPEFATEGSSISEFTHPTVPAVATSSCVFPKPVPREILSKTAVPSFSTQQVPSVDLSSLRSVGIIDPSAVIGPAISSDESDSDSSSDSDTDEEELYSFANKMFGTAAKPEPKKVEKEIPTPETSNLTPEMCEMERRRQKQEESRALTMKEVNAILQEEEMNSTSGPEAYNWVRRSVRQPSLSLLNAPLTKRLLDKLRGNDADMVILKMKKYLPDPATPMAVIDATLDALEDCTNCESLYIQVREIFARFLLVYCGSFWLPFLTWCFSFFPNA